MEAKRDKELRNEKLVPLVYHEILKLSFNLCEPVHVQM